jgi:hypothetical protein
VDFNSLCWLRFLPWAPSFNYLYLARPLSSVGQSRRLIIVWSSVQVTEGPPVIFNGLLAQTVEQWTFNPLVNGSNPLQPTILISELRLGVSPIPLVKILKNKVEFCDRAEYTRCVYLFNLRTLLCTYMYRFLYTPP